MGSRGASSKSAKGSSNPFSIASKDGDKEPYTDKTRIFLYKEGKVYDTPKAGYRVKAQAEMLEDDIARGDITETLKRWNKSDENASKRYQSVLENKKFVEYFIKKYDGNASKAEKEKFVKEVLKFKG